MLSHNWETTYEGIHRANFAIEKLDALSEGILSEARKINTREKHSSCEHFSTTAWPRSTEACL